MRELPNSKRRQAGRGISVQEFKAITEDEGSLERTCEEWLNVQRIPFIRVPDAAYKAIFGNRQIDGRTKSLVSSFMKGLPDITILNPDGRYLCIELKTSKGKQSQGQINFERKVPNHYRIIRSFEDFEKQVEEFLNE